MKWFKHFSDNYRGASINHIFNEMGHTWGRLLLHFDGTLRKKLERLFRTKFGTF